MSVAQGLDLWFRHNEILIELFIVLVVLVTGVSAYLNYRSSRDVDLGLETGGTDFSKLEVTLKTILEKAGTIGTGASGPPAQESTELMQQIQELKGELEGKQKEMETLRLSAGASANAGMSEAEKADLEKKLAELQKKLEEYDIIAQDIADLSFFKDENVRLQKELEALKASGKASAAPAATPASTAAPTPVAPPVAPVQAVAPAPPAAEPAAVVKDIVEGPVTDADIQAFSAEVASQTQTQAPPVEAAATEVLTDSIVADWEAAVAEQKTKSSEPAGPRFPLPPAAAQGQAPETPVLAGDLDLDKMVAEAGAFESGAGRAEAETGLGNPLEQQMDPDKLAAEADKLAVSSDTKHEMDEFEKFIKKGN